MAISTPNYTKITDRNVSFGLLRTNPKLTSNVKLTVDSGGDLWLNSIDASDLLAKQQYKKVPINKNSNHESNIFRFYDEGATPSKISFAVASSIRNDVMARDLKDQYDFDLYTSGAKYLSADYPEKFCYFAPMYLDTILPEYFVIFKATGASTYTVGQWRQNLQDPNFSQLQFTKDFFRTATIIKSFSLKETSNLGTYIRRIQQNRMYPKNPLYVNFKQGGYSLYRGISINSGTYVEIPESQGQVLRKAVPQLELEKYITGGFERNNVVYPKILNLEFLFDDDSSQEYEINRYFGFYCNAIDLAKFDIDLVKMYDNDEDNENSLPSLYTKYDDVSFKLTNQNGVVLRGESVEADLSFITDALSNENTLMFPYLRTKDDELHFVKVSGEGLQDFSQIKSNITFSVDDTVFDIGKMFGPHTLFSQETAQEIPQDTRTTVLLQVVEPPSHLDTLRIYHEAGSTFDPLDSVGTYDDLVFVSDYFNTDEEYSVEYPEIEKIEFYLSGTNDPNGIAQTFTPNIRANSTDSVTMDLDSITFTVDTVIPFEVDALVKIYATETYSPSNTPAEGRYMLGTVTAIDESLSTVEITTSYKKGQGTYSSWIIERHKLGVQYVSVGSGTDGSIWHSNGQEFVPGAVGSRIYVNLDNAVIDFDPSSTPQGSKTDTAKLAGTISKIVQDLYLTHLVSANHKNSTFIQSRPFGNTYGSLALKNVNDSPAFMINGKLGDSVVWADGGSLKPQVIIPGGNIDRLTPLLDSLVVRTHENWSRIHRVCRSAAYVNNNTGGLDDNSARNYLTRATLVISDKERVKVNYNKVEIRNLFKPSLGLLSLFEIKDMDFSIYSSDYAKIPEIDLYQYYYIPAETRLLDFTQKVYKVIGEGSITVMDEVFEASKTGTILWKPFPGLHKYSIVSGNPVIIESEYRPGGIFDYSLEYQGTTVGNDNFTFENDQVVTPYVDPDDAAIIFERFKAAQGKAFGTSTSSVNLSGTFDPDYPIFITTQPGLDFETGAVTTLINGVNYIKIIAFANLENYFEGLLRTYDLQSGSLEIVVTSVVGSGTFSDWYIYRPDSPLSTPAYRLYQPGRPDSYLDAELTFVERTAYGPSNSFPRIQFNVVEAVGPVETGTGWQIWAKTPSNASLRADVPIRDADGNLTSFTGFFGLGADHSIPSTETITYPYREKYRTNNLQSEYDVYLENFSSKFSTDSKIVPYISKWGITSSTDSRGNPYRLNADLAFGKDNFGPSHRETIPTAEKLTHEWFYIESSFNYEFDLELARKNYYYFNFPLNVDQIISSPTYFETYFTYVPTFNNDEVDRPQFRYSKLIKNRFSRQYETIFNGAKFVFSELNEAGVIQPITNRFEDYNFSILLKPVKEDLANPQKPVNYRIIENLDAKSILVLIEVAVSGRDKISTDLLLNNNREYLANQVLTQSNLFKIGYLTEPNSYRVQIDYIYTTTDDLPGDTEFRQFKIDDVSNLTSLTGTAIDARTGLEIENFSIQPGDTVLVIKGSDETQQLLLALPQSQVFELVNDQTIKDICALDAIGPDVYGPSSLPLGTLKFYKISTSKRIILNGISYNTVRLSGDSYEIDKNSQNEISIRPLTPSWKSMFGDFRLGFNGNGVSNLTYNFLYSVKDKKYNAEKSAFSTVKLAKGISLKQPIETNRRDLLTEVEYFLAERQLAGLPERAFRLESFVNPISGGSSDQRAFAPIMLINSKGKTSILLSSSVDFDLSKNSLENIVDGLSLSKLTNHAIKRVSSAGLTISTISQAYLTNTLTSVLNGSAPNIGSQINMVTRSYVGQEIIINLTSNFNTTGVVVTDLYNIGDQIKISHQSNRNNNYLLARVSRKLSGNPTQIVATVYYQNSSSQPATPGVTYPWRLEVEAKTLVINPSLEITGETALQVSAVQNSYPVPLGTDSTWTTENQQFQLFGGKDYFTQLFQNLSFANFIKLIDSPSEIVSWETYSGGQRVKNEITGDKLFTIRVDAADRLEKSTVVVPSPERVETSEGSQVGGYSQSEKAVPKYEVFRYSGEYDVIFKPITGFKYQNQLGDFSLPGSNVRLNSGVSNFFVLPELFYIKYSDKRLLDLEESTKYRAKYPLISESPIDYTKFNVLSSSWDFNYHYKYQDKITKTAIAGTNRITEDYSFVSKLINLPLELEIEPTGFQELTQRQFEVTDQEFADLGIDFAFLLLEASVKLKINIKRLIAKKLISGGLGTQFDNFFTDQFSQVISTDSDLIGDRTLSQYKLEYCETNLSKLYKVAALDFYSKPDYALAENALSFSQVSYDQLADQGYSPFTNVQINSLNSAILNCSIPNTSSTGLSLVPKLKIKYI